MWFRPHDTVVCNENYFWVSQRGSYPPHETLERVRYVMNIISVPCKRDAYLPSRDLETSETMQRVAFSHPTICRKGLGIWSKWFSRSLTVVPALHSSRHSKGSGIWQQLFLCSVTGLPSSYPTRRSKGLWVWKNLFLCSVTGAPPPPETSECFRCMTIIISVTIYSGVFPPPTRR